MNRHLLMIPVFALAAIIGIGLAMLAIAKADAPTPAVETQQGIITIDDRTIMLVHLEDGTRCAVLHGLRAGGIDCDWDESQR